MNLVYFFLLLFSSSILADTPTDLHHVNKLKVTALVSFSDGAYVYFDGNHQCQSNRAFISEARADFDRLYSTLLAAQISDAYLAVDVNGTNGSCNRQHSNLASVCIGDISGPCFILW